MEMEFHRVMPVGVSVHTARMLLPEVSEKGEKVEALLEMTKNVERAAREVASVKASIIVYGCTSGSFVEGLGYDLELANKIEKHTGIKVLTASTAVVEAMKELNFKQISMATPYHDAINKLEKKFLEDNIPDLRVKEIKGLQLVENIPKGKLEPYTAYEMARELDKQENDGVFISCTNWRTMEILEILENDLKKPVISSNQAAIWAALRAVNIHEPIMGFGSLLRDHM
jgi:maleate isomerase